MSDRASTRLAMLLVAATALAGCGDASSSQPADATVRERIAALAPSANLGHRGTGLTRPGHPFPENSISSYQEAIAVGANGIELDVELTSDGGLIVMHDDTLDRTTSCSGCVSDYTLAAVRECQLLDGDGNPTSQHPPTLEETYAALPSDALVNVELKVYSGACLTSTTGPEPLAQTAVAEVSSLGVLDRTLFSSFDAVAAGAVETTDPSTYSALLVDIAESTALGPSIALALSLGLDAVHPFLLVEAPDVARALAAGLQVNIWTVDAAAAMNESIDAGATAIITDQPAILTEVLAERRAAQ